MQLKQSNNKLIYFLIALFFGGTTPIHAQHKVPLPLELLKNQNTVYQMAPDSPHWGNGINCESCHIAHQSPGAQLTKLKGNANLCMSCHNPVGVASDLPFTDSDIAEPGVSGTSHAWGVPAVNNTYGAAIPTNAEMATRIYDNNIVCSTCHNQHKQTFPPFLRASNYQNALCKDCHAIRNIGSYRDDPNNKGSHPVGIVYPASDSRFYSSPQNPDLLLIDPDRVECTTCHSPHYADSGGANGGSGDGYILRAINNSSLCQDCHTYPAHEGQDCRQCHQPHDPERTNIFLVNSVVATPNSGDQTVVFIAESGTNSFADGDNNYDGICEVCHTETDFHRNDGTGNNNHHAGENCTSCHPHKDGFIHGGSGTGCESCHGHDDGWAGNSYYGTTESHSTHTENDNDDLRGPYLSCGDCHDTNNFPYFKSGTDSDGNNKYDLAETDVCNNCHSPGGSFDGVNDNNIGAKNNWSDGVYNGSMLAAGKDEWCAGCHDQEQASSNQDGTGVAAPAVIGNNYSYGYYITGHGKGSISVKCLDCHNSTMEHLDGDPRTYRASSDNYQAGYRLAYSMKIPLYGHDGYAEDKYELCFVCHNYNDFFDSTPPFNTYFRDDNEGVNDHYRHLTHGPGKLDWDSDWDYPAGNTDSRRSCPACHNVHGSDRPRMIRNGELISTPGTGDKVPALDFRWYQQDGTTQTDILSQSYYGDMPPMGGPGAGSIQDSKVCDGCHSGPGQIKYYRTPSNSNPPNTPSNVSPPDGATGVSTTPTLESSAFSDPDAGDTHQASQWQITTAPGKYDTPVYDSGVISDLTSHTITMTLDGSTQYYWRVRHQDNNGAWSNYSTETSFTTMPANNNAPDTPTNNSPVNGATDVSTTPTLESSAFSDPDAGDTHQASQWQITITSGDYGSPIYDSGVTPDLTSHTVSTALNGSTLYYWHVRHQDNNGAWSNYSTETSFTTVSTTQWITPASVYSYSDPDCDCFFENSENMIDDNTNTGNGSCKGGPTHCMAFELDYTGAQYEITAVRLYGSSSHTENWTVAVSNDGTNFTSVGSWAVGGAGKWYEYTLSSPATARYIKIYDSHPGPDDANIVFEFDFAGTLVK